MYIILNIIFIDRVFERKIQKGKKNSSSGYMIFIFIYPTVPKSSSISPDSPGVHDSPSGCCQLQRSTSDRCRGLGVMKNPVKGD
jgi:hypothetical protein